MTEARIRNMASFSRFLESASFSNGEMVNYSNIASQCSVSGNIVKEYFQILEDTLTGRFLPSFQKKPKRRVILAPKFYFFDVGIANFLLKRGRIEPGSEAFGKAFEHFIYQEIYAHSKYTELDYPIHYWRTASQMEVLVTNDPWPRQIDDIIILPWKLFLEQLWGENLYPEIFRFKKK